MLDTKQEHSNRRLTMVTDVAQLLILQVETTKNKAQSLSKVEVWTFLVLQAFWSLISFY